MAVARYRRITEWMRQRLGVSRVLTCVIVALALQIPAAPLAAEEAWITDIMANPSRYWNREVTIVGQVQTANPNPVGTTRGTYTLMDDSSQTPINVRTKDLPPVGREYAVTGVIIQDPTQANRPLLDELGRRQPGMPQALRYSLIGAAGLFLLLLVVFLVLLVRPQRSAAQSAAASPPSQPSAVAAPVPGGKTERVEPRSSSAGGATESFMNLRAELVVERGADRGKVFPLHKNVTTIGRSGGRSNDVELSDTTASKEQAAIYYDAPTHEFSVVNQSTTNPTTIADRMLAEATLMKDGDVIEFGKNALRFRRT